MKRKHIGLLAALGLGCVILGIFLIYKHVNSTDSHAITATVTEVISRPNQAEDGYYGLTVKDKAGKEYQIDATGFLNSAMPPSQSSIACVTVPSLEKGDTIVFMLPNEASADPQNSRGAAALTTCYDKDQPGKYFIRKR